ncbi:hypothetical protein AwWohl_03990 [Gammaproteobacteria bacterium]|nr:hypothetical protein AwWohl_03990 [Gammaproteobacteria bacterium]
MKKSRNQLYLNQTYSQHAVLQHEIADRCIDYLSDGALTPAHIINLLARDSYLTTRLQAQYLAANIQEIFTIADANLLKPHNADLLISNLCLQDEDDIGAVINLCWHSLKPDAHLMITAIGFGSLESLVFAQNAMQINIFPEIKALGNALHAAGFIETVMHIEKITLTYTNLQTLLDDIRITGVRPFTDFKGLRTARWFKNWEDEMKQTHFNEQTGLYSVEFEIIYGSAKMPEFIATKAENGVAYFSIKDLKKA